MVLVVGLILSSCGDATPADVSDEAIVGQFLSWGDPESQDLMQRRYSAAVEDATATCMALRGFEYTPVSPEAYTYGPGIGISREDFAGRFGFGVTTNDAYFAAAMEAADGSNPNDDYVFALEPQERKTYSEAFVSCMEAAGEDIAPPPSFVQELRRLEDSVRRTPEAIRAQDDWATCMVLDGGFAAVRSLEELTSLLQLEYEDARNTADVLASLQETEIAMAVRNLECERELNNRLALVAIDFEREFTDENQEEIADQRRVLGG